jgi:hypothetical protein
MNRVSRRLALTTLASAAASVVGCAGYQLGDIKPSIYSEVDSLFIPTFENETLEPRISTIVTDSVIKGLQTDGTYSIARNAESSDAVLKGKIKEIRRQQLRAARTDTLRTTELSVYVIVEWSLHDPVTGAKLKYTVERDLNDTNVEATTNVRNRPGRVFGQTIQFIDGNFQTSERNAIPLAAQNAAEQLVIQLTEGW